VAEEEGTVQVRRGAFGGGIGREAPLSKAMAGIALCRAYAALLLWVRLRRPLFRRLGTKSPIEDFCCPSLATTTATTITITITITITTKPPNGRR
jgi:hypothetical protein